MNRSSSDDSFADCDSPEFPILGDNNVSPVTPDTHPNIRSSQRFSFRSSKQKLAFSPMSRTQSSSSSSLAGSKSLSDRLSMMNIPTQDLKGAVFYGWLWKRGQSFKTWKKRFFLLNGAVLTYYTQCCVIASDVLGGGGTQCLDLPVRGGLRVGKVVISDLTSFGLRITSSSGRVLYVQAGDQESRVQWLKVLREAPQMRGEMMGRMRLRGTMASDLSFEHSFQTDGESPFATSLSVLSNEDYEQSLDMQGYLYVRGGLLHGWKKRFVTLIDGHLCVRRGQTRLISDLHDPLSKSVEVLTGVPWSGHANGICIRLGNNKEMFVYAEQDVDASMWLTALKRC